MGFIGQKAVLLWYVILFVIIEEVFIENVEWIETLLSISTELQYLLCQASASSG